MFRFRLERFIGEIKNPFDISIRIFLGITLAITRDGSSGGCARLAIINKDGVERVDVLGNDLPKVFDL